MEQILYYFSVLYPATLLVLIVLVAIWYSLDIREKKSKILNFLLFISVISYFVSFFGNYELELFMIAWGVRDLIIFYVLTKIWELFIRYKVYLITIFSVLVIGLSVLYYQRDKIDVLKANQATFEFEKSAELLFDIKNVNHIEQIKNILKEYNVEISKAFPQIKDTAITDLDDYYTIDIENTSQLKAVINDLEKSGLADWIEDNDIYKLSPVETNSDEYKNAEKYSSLSLNDPQIMKLWSFKYMDIDNLLKSLKKKKPTNKAKIFILDTGVDCNHEDLQGNYISLSEQYDKDTDKHGTHCAGIACAVSNNKKGIASLNLTGEFTTITSITVLPGGSGTQEGVIDGIILAADNGADVISMSLGGSSTHSRQKAYNDAIKYANDKGAIVVVAAGNESTNALNSVPAACKGVITVSAVDENLNKARFSNYVSDIEYKIAAPGVNIYSTTPYNEYQSFNGTSMATPFVAGLLGIMKSINPELNTNEAYRIISSTGIDTKNTEQTGKFIQPLKAIANLNPTGVKSWIIRFFNKLMIIKPKRLYL